MFDSVRVADAVAQLVEGAGALLALDAERLGGADLVAALVAVETHRRQLAAVEHLLVAAAQVRG
ncbi:MAG: hypothetical protein M3O28_00305, partial [Actinomycetota bacterium]|nr:hypothetical protein [Actinomycetota bacterium]